MSVIYIIKLNMLTYSFSILDCIEPSQFNQNLTSQQLKKIIKPAFAMTVPAQLNLSGVISVMMRLIFLTRTHKSWEMSKCIGHKYGQ